MLVKACVNGNRPPSGHPDLPTSAVDIAGQVAACAAAGAGAAHIHAKDGRGRDTLAAEHVDPLLDLVRDRAPRQPVGLTTGAWILPDPRDRVAAVRSWARPPDFASVNWHEEGAERVAAALLDRGIGVEAGLWDLRAARRWAASPLRADCIRVLVELPAGLAHARCVEQADRMLEVVREHRADAHIVLHGADDTAWPMFDHAVRNGLGSRIGFEDVTVLPDGTPAVTNAELVTVALARAAGAGPRPSDGRHLA